MRSDARPPKPACHLQRTTPRWAELRPPETARPVRLIRLEHDTDFAGWRRAARSLRAGAVAPEAVSWAVGAGGGDLFAEAAPEAEAPAAFTVPRDFVELAEEVICHSAADRFDLLYRLLWRLGAEPNLLKIPTDAEVARAAEYRKNVAKAVHKMHAFVRFRLVEGAEEETYVAWFEPAHHVVERATPFFVRRFANMRFSILTPERCAHWDGEALTFTPGASAEEAPSEDELEAFWRTYYASIFNPARLKTRAMQKEMPKRYWRNLPEATLIPELIQQAGSRTQAMVEAAPTAPARRAAKGPSRDQLEQPHEGVVVRSVEEVWPAVQGCRRCDLWRNATQGVAGVGPPTARLMLVGEQPGDVEDLNGQPFIGPAGQLLDRALAEAGVDRAEAYVTNSVKHFKFEPRGKRRLHKSPDAGEVRACRWWLDQERQLVQPKVVVAMGSTAAGAVFGRTMPILKSRGQAFPLEGGEGLSGGLGFVTVHPSYLLRLPDAQAKATGFKAFVEDLRAAAALAHAS